MISRSDFTLLDITKHYGATSGGVRTYLDRKAAYVAATPGLKQVVVVPGDRDCTSAAGPVTWHWLYGPPIPGQAPYRLLWRPGRVREIVAAANPDLIEVGSPFLVPWLARLAARGLDRPIVWFVHGNLPRIVAPDPAAAPRPARAVRRLAGWYMRQVGRPMDAILAASDAAARDLEREGIGPVERVRLGVDLELFHPRRRERRDAARQAAGLPIDRPLAIYAGRLAAEKRLDVVLAAWPEVARRTGAQLALVGTGPAAARLRVAAGNAPVSWVPFQQDRERLADLLAAADLYLAPGPAETFGLAALEAMASGVPVLSVDSGGVPELVHAARAGAVYPVGDAAALADAAIRLLEHDDGAGDRARRYAEQHHAWDSVLSRLFAVYRRVAS